MLQPSNQASSQPTLVTLSDAITDSPVYRANIYHFDEQVDLLEKWLDTLSKQMKLYCDKLHAFNLETNAVCKAVMLPTGIDDALIDPNFAGAVISSFSDALQKSLAFKTKLISQIKDGFIQPVQDFAKTQLKAFKDFRKDHEKAMARYEAQLNKYADISKTTEVSAVREEAFRLYEARKFYAHMSGQHVLRILHFRSVLEHALVEHFGSVTLSHLEEFDEGTIVWRNLESSLESWKQWLVDDKNTCDYQLHKLHQARERLANEYIKNIKPYRHLDKYEHNERRASLADKISSTEALEKLQMVAGENQPSTCKKWGYLFIRGSRGYWERRWFFLCNGHFGYCNNPSKLKGKITVVERLSVLLCEINPRTDLSRRNCFEVRFAVQPPLVLQAESEEDMHSWIATFSASKQLSVERSVVEDSTRPDTRSDLTVSPAPSESPYRPSIVVLSTSPDYSGVSLANATSLTSMLVWEAANARLQSSSTISPLPSSNLSSPVTTNSTSWGIPWTLVPSMFQSAIEGDNTSSILSIQSSATDNVGQPIVWPPLIENTNIAKVELSGYDAGLEARNRELRHLFGGVAPHEIVLDAYIGSLKKRPSETEGRIKEAPKVALSPTSPTAAAATIFDEREQEFNTKLEGQVKPPQSEFGYSYTGRVYVTQETFWFYSCVLMTCVNTVAIRLKDIKEIRLIRDRSIANKGNKSNAALAIDLEDKEKTVQSPLILTTLMDDIELVAEKLRIAVESAKSPEDKSLQLMYEILHSLSKVISKKKEVPDIKLSVSEPLKAKSTPDLHAAAAAAAAAQDRSQGINSEEPHTSPTPSKKKKKSPSVGSASVNKSALAAAMMAATVAGGSGFFDVSKVTNMEEEPRPSKRNGHHAQKPEPSPTADSNKKDDTKHSHNMQDAAENSSLGSQEKIPAHIQVPIGPVSCECAEHLDKVECEVEIPLSAKKLYEVMWSEDRTGPAVGGGIWEEKAIESKCKDLKVETWGKVDGKPQRTLKYIMPVANPMVKVKETELVETQVVLKKEEYIRYIVQITTKTAALPYADSFIPSIRYCITWVNETHCKLTCSIGVQFLKSIMMKRVVKKAAMDGMAESLAIFVPIIQDVATKGGSVSKSPKTRAADTHHRASIKNTKRTSVMAAGANKDMDKDGWLSQCISIANTLWSIFTDLPLGIRISAVVLVTISLLIMLRAGAHPGDRHVSSGNTAINGTTPMIVSKAVYLKDLEEGLLKLDLQPADYVHTDSFSSFLQSKSSNAPDKLEERYAWFNPRHQQFSVELLFSRERIAMLRHDALVIFRMLNRVDAQLLENEYLNWLLDTRQRCQDEFTSTNAPQCEKVFLQLQDLARKGNSVLGSVEPKEKK